MSLLGDLGNFIGLGTTSQSSGSSQAVLTPEQQELLKLQTGALRDIFLPQYQKAQTGAGDVYNMLSPYQNKAALNLFNTSTGAQNYALGNAQNYMNQGYNTLSSLFDPNYEEGQVQAALQTGREAAREAQAGQNAMYGGAGGLGSSRMALADRNLRSLNEQRMGTAAANARAGVQANRANAAQSIMGTGLNLGTFGLNAGSQALNAAQSPMDLYNKYASVIYGVPQASTNPNFAGTQGSTNQSYGTRFSLFG